MGGWSRLVQVCSTPTPFHILQGMVDEDIDVKQFCNRHVEVMGTESDHIHIVALSDALQVSSGK